MRAAGLQIDGHADHVAATWFGIAYQSLKFQIGIFSDALVLHADIQAKRARCLSGLPPLNNADQKAERLHHPRCTDTAADDSLRNRQSVSAPPRRCEAAENPAAWQQ